MMVARCPRCTTAFRVAIAQLEVRQGQVRCGRCNAVFDARKTLSVEPDPPSTPAAEQRLLESSAAAETASAAPAERAALAQAVPAPEMPKTPAQREQRDQAPAPVPAAYPQPLKPAVAAKMVEMDFGPKKRRTSWLWWPAGAVALFAFAAQAAFYFRGEIALVYPEVKPLFKQLCSDFGCEVPLPTRPELMSIESSDLQADTANPGVMVLTATLRNRAAFPQAHPALELTLTDDKDQALARRVLAAKDYLGQGVRLDPGFPANTEIPVKVFIEAVSIKPTGYRLYLFYP